MSLSRATCSVETRVGLLGPPRLPVPPTVLDSPLVVNSLYVLRVPMQIPVTEKALPLLPGVGSRARRCTVARDPNGRAVDIPDVSLTEDAEASVDV